MVDLPQGVPAVGGVRGGKGDKPQGDGHQCSYCVWTE
jgi:hypothetical protein